MKQYRKGWFTMLVTEEEREHIKAAARSRGMDMSDWVRYTAREEYERLARLGAIRNTKEERT
jgi:uncharacterized protein (DUF1778 family)